MDEILTTVNWTAVLVGAALALGLGMLWFGPLFGKAWAAGSHNIQAPERMPMGALGLQVAGTFLMSWTIGALATIGALQAAIIAILAIASLSAAGSLFSLKTTRAALIDGGFVLAAGALMIGSHAAP